MASHAHDSLAIECKGIHFFRNHTALKDEMTSAKAIGIDIIRVRDSKLAPDYDRRITFIQNATIKTSPLGSA